MPDLGDLVALTVDIRDAAGVLANATTVTLTVMRPDGTTELPAVSNPTPGRYQVDYQPLQSGRHVALWVASGVNSAAHVEPFDVAGPPTTAGWPPLLADLRRELKRGEADRGDDDLLQSALDAAVEYVQKQRAGDLNFAGDPLSLLPAPGPLVRQGTVELARRWHHRRASPDGLVDMGELGSARVPGSDPDIDRKLGIGRYRAPMVG